jgi:hypothetical protein
MNSRSVVAQHPEKWALRVDHHRCLKAVSGAGRRDVARQSEWEGGDDQEAFLTVTAD